MSPSPDRLRLMMSLLKEETRETLDAMTIVAPDDETARERLAKIADGLADVNYIVVGIALELGIPLAAVWDVVHASNMKKAGAPKDANGKQMKPPDWKAPDVLGAVFGKGP